MGFFKVLFYLWGFAYLLWGLSRFYKPNNRLEKIFKLRDFIKENSLNGVKIKKLEDYPDNLGGYLVYHGLIGISFTFWCILGMLFTSLNWFGFVLGLGAIFILGIIGTLVKQFDIIFVIYYTIYWSAYICFVGFLIINAFHLNINIFNYIS